MITEKTNQLDKYKYYAYAEPDNSYTLTLSKLKRGFKYKVIKINEYTYKIEIVRKFFVGEIKE